MEVDEMDSPKQQASKYTRVSSNGDKMDTSSIGDTGAMLNGTVGGGGGEMVQSTRFGRQWQHSSRIIRVSRASGGKDRHSKVWTAKGPRDRRVRLSVTTAIQFYDLQDRLGYDQPSKAVEWLIRNASDAINELPSLNACVFPPDTPRQQLTDDLEMDNNGNGACAGQKSGCSSNNSETSKGSGLSLSRTESRVKARERARERTAKDNKDKDKDKDKEKDVVEHAAVDQVCNNRVTVASHQSGSGNVRPMETSSFTQLLTAGINTNLSDNRGSSSTPSPHHHGGSAKNNNNLEWLNSSCGTTTAAAAATAHVADYFGNGLMGISSGSRPRNPIQLLGNATVLPHVMSLLPYATSHEMQQHHHNQQQHFPFLLDQHQHQHLVQVPNNTTTTSTTGFGGSEYNLNFSMSPSSTTSGLGAGFNRGTLQSNSSSPSMLSYLQRFSNTDGSSVPFFLGGAPISPVVDNEHHHHHHNQHHHQQFDPAGLQLCYGDESRHPDQKGKGKN